MTRRKLFGVMLGAAFLVAFVVFVPLVPTGSGPLGTYQSVSLRLFHFGGFYLPLCSAYLLVTTTSFSVPCPSEGTTTATSSQNTVSVVTLTGKAFGTNQSSL